MNQITIQKSAISPEPQRPLSTTNQHPSENNLKQPSIVNDEQTTSKDIDEQPPSDVEEIPSNDPEHPSVHNIQQQPTSTAKQVVKQLNQIKNRCG